MCGRIGICEEVCYILRISEWSIKLSQMEVFMKNRWTKFQCFLYVFGPKFPICFNLLGYFIIQTDYQLNNPVAYE